MGEGGIPVLEMNQARGFALSVDAELYAHDHGWKTLVSVNGKNINVCPQCARIAF